MMIDDKAKYNLNDIVKIDGEEVRIVGVSYLSNEPVYSMVRNNGRFLSIAESDIPKRKLVC